MNLSLRAVQPDDNDFLLALYASTRREEIAMFGWSPEQQELFCRMQFTAQQSWYQSAYSSADFAIILDAAEPIGRIIVLRTPAELRLVDISLLPEHRGAGIGTMLISRLLDEANRAQLPVRLQVLNNNRARHLYERLGFVLCGGDDVYYQMERMPE
jgi:ribosomal protein S18 acetylase RimI-like enzyme